MLVKELKELLDKYDGDSPILFEVMDADNAEDFYFAHDVQSVIESGNFIPTVTIRIF